MLIDVTGTVVNLLVYELSVLVTMFVETGRVMLAVLVTETVEILVLVDVDSVFVPGKLLEKILNYKRLKECIAK